MRQTADPDQAGSTRAARWAQVLARDPAADGQFVYAVRTTGIYCRPSCPSRHAKIENVSFYPNAAAAEQDGYRPCLRCQPQLADPGQQQAALIASLCRQLETAEAEPSLSQIAQRNGISPSHLSRLFKQATGLTPRAYAAGQRAQRLRQQLASSDSVTAASYGAGYQSSGHFYQEAPRVLGMTPSQYRAGGSHSSIRFALGQCSLGAILVAQSQRGVCAIDLGDDPESLIRAFQDRFPAAELIGADPAFEQLVAQVVGLVESPQQTLELPLDIRGTAFQQRVWQALRNIAPGETASYRQIAERIGTPSAVRAVAGACAANQLAIAIPCHRVVRSDGTLSGYRWGVERKAALLAREAQAQPDHPKK